jgi:hypothetical protein
MLKGNLLWRSIVVASRNSATRSIDAEVPEFQSEAVRPLISTPGGHDQHGKGLM